MATARKHDVNGWYEIEGNPLSKAGIFDYLGSTINAPEPDRIYKVYRPASELADPACIKSFQLLPWIVEHDMLGEGEIPAEKKGIEGIIGQDVYYDDGYLRGNIKVFSDRLSELIETGRKELSLGYKCAYEFTPGSLDGEHFDAVQRTIRGNHLATVEEGRMGPDVSVLDQATITFDSRDFVMTTKAARRAKKGDTPKPQAKADTTDGMMEGTEGEDMEPTLADLSSMIGKLMPLIEEVEKLKMAMNGEEKEATMMDPDMDGMKEEEMEDMGTHGDEMHEEEREDMEDMEDEEEMEDGKKEKEKGMDGLKKQIMALRKDIKSLKQQPPAMDSKAIFGQIARRDDMAAKLSRFVGAFDHSTMTAGDVARYGVKKLGIPCDTGHEAAALGAYLYNRQPAKCVKHGTTDSANKDFIKNLFEGAQS